MMWRLYYKKLGNHVHCRLFCGPQLGALGKCGDLVFQHHEFTEFTRLRKVIAMEFLRETTADGELAGEDVVEFASLP